MRSLQRFRLLTTRHLQWLHFAGHETELAAARTCTRVLRRLEAHGLLNPLERRIGGVRRGSTAIVWQLGATGENYLRSLDGTPRRKRYLEPGGQFVHHTLAVNDVAIRLLASTVGRSDVQIETLDTEPGNWRRFTGIGGEAVYLRPDLRVVTISEDDDGAFEEHAFLEIDLGTEHLPRIQTKCRVYAAYAASGAYQARHGLFPTVVWLCPDPTRRARLRAAVAATAGLLDGTFQVRSPESYLRETLRA
ncbi:replication-relaxation family protein [Nocardioides marmoraquaticus]